MSEHNVEDAQCSSEKAVESGRPSMSEDAETLDPQKLLQRVHELEGSCRTYQEQNSMLQSEALAFQLNLEDVWAEKARWQELVTENIEIKEQFTWVSNILSTVERVREKTDIYIQKLEEENTSLSEENETITTEVVQLQSLSKKLKTENENLKAEVQDLRENEKILTDNLATEHNLVESLSKKKEIAIKQLREEVESLQCNEKILNQQNMNLIADVAQLECLYVKNQAEIKQFWATVYELEQHAQATQQDHRVEHMQLQKVAALETGNKKLLAALQDLQESETSLNERNKTISGKLALAETHIDKIETQNENLQVEVYDLQENEKTIKEKHASLAAEVEDFESWREKKQAENENLKEAVHKLRRQLKEAEDINKENNEVMQELTHTESLVEKKQAEIKKLGKKLHDLLEKEDFLNRQNESMSDKLTRLELLKDKQSEENTNMKTTVQALQLQLDDACLLIRIKDELITKQERNISYKQEQIEELCTITTATKESMKDLQEKQELSQMEKILAGIENFREESRKAEITEILNSSKRQTAESFLGSSAPEVQNKSLWRRCAKGLLKACLHVGIATAGVLIPAGILVSKLTAECSQLDCPYHLPTDYCGFGVGVPY